MREMPLVKQLPSLQWTTRLKWTVADYVASRNDDPALVYREVLNSDQRARRSDGRAGKVAAVFKMEGGRQGGRLIGLCTQAPQRSA